MMKTKSEVAPAIQSFVELIATQFGKKIKMIRTDNGLKFQLPQFYSARGIIHQRSCVETPQQNGRVERRHQHLLNIARSLLFHFHAPKTLWNYVVLHF